MPFGVHRSHNEQARGNARSSFFDLESDRQGLPFPIGHKLLYTLPPLTLRLSMCADRGQPANGRQQAIAEIGHVLDMVLSWCSNTTDEISVLDEDVRNSAPTTAVRALSAIKCHARLQEQIPEMIRALLECKPEVDNTGCTRKWEETSRALSLVESKMTYFSFPPHWTGT